MRNDHDLGIITDMLISLNSSISSRMDTSTISLNGNLAIALMESSSPEKVIISDYKLALKFFVNKDFAKSFPIIQKLHEYCYKNFELGTLGENYFIKIITLYLTEVGLLVNPKDTGNSFQLSRVERKELVQKLELGVFLDNLYKIYGSMSNVPLELLFQIYLVNYTCQNVMSKDQQSLVKQFNKVYTLLDFKSNTNDKFLKRWVDMYVFNVLPDAEDFSTAFRVSEENPFIDTEKARTKLQELQELKKQEKKVREKKAQELQSKEAQRLEQEKIRQRKAKDESDLKFKSLKQIRQERERDESMRKEGTSSTNRSHSKLTIDQIKSRLEYLLHASSNVFQKNSSIILIVILLSFIASRIIRTKRINIREKIQETLKMAFKVTYL